MSLGSSTMNSAGVRLCDQCTKIINLALFKKNIDGQTEKPDSEVDFAQILSKTCSFCELIQHCLNKNPDLLSQGRLRGISDGRELQLYLDSRRLSYCIRLCEPTIKLDSGRLIHNSPRFDTKELRRWLRECDGHRCLAIGFDRRSEAHHRFPEHFRVIDVHEKRIIQLKTEESVQYCALSYVWGTTNQSFLTSTTKDDLEAEGGVARIKHLPQTIRDAMDLCQSIDIRYLWVDSLCIIQDSNEDKHNQVHSMDSIYSQSYLGIIAAAGPDAESGLPPFGRFGRRFAIESLLVDLGQHGKFIATKSPQIAAEDIGKSIWATRGWTLQEQALPRRVLFFTGNYTFFRCKESLWSEDFGLGFSDHYDKIQRFDLPAPAFHRRKSIDGRIYSTTFKNLLGTYLQRVLRFEKDILNAFTGLLVRLKEDIGLKINIANSEEYDIGHIWGLPAKRFSVALLWKAEQPFPTTQRFGFPSWSWTGWLYDLSTPRLDYKVHDLYHDTDENLTNESAVACWIIVEDKGVLQIEHITIASISGPFKPKLSNEETETTCDRSLRDHIVPQCLFSAPPSEISDFIKDWRSPSSSPISQHIFIWASCATVHVDRVGNESCYSFRAYTKSMVTIGFIDLKPEWREKAGNDMELFVATAGLYSTEADLARPSEIRVKVVFVERLYERDPSTIPVYRRIQVSRSCISLRDWVSCSPRNRLIAVI